MNLKKIYVVSALFLIILTMGAVSATDDNLTATENYDNQAIIGESHANQKLGNTLKPSGNTFADVQKAIDNAEDNGIVELEGVYTGNTVINSNKSITLEGKNGGATFDGSLSNKEDGIIVWSNDYYDDNYEDDDYNGDESKIETISLTLKNLKFINYSGYSAVSAWDNVNLTVLNCSFINCRSDTNIDDWLRGGAIECVNSYSEIFNCRFINCSSESGGALSSMAEHTLINSCEFTNCSANHGGAVFISSKGTIQNSNFTNNNVNHDGGAIYGEFRLVNIFNCNFINNNANGLGSAIFAFCFDEIDDETSDAADYNLILTNSNFINNVALNNSDNVYIFDNFKYNASNDIFIYGDNPRGMSVNCTELSYYAPEIKVVLKPTKLSTTYDSGKKFKITVLNLDNVGVYGVKLALKIYTGKKIKTYYVKTNFNGVASFKYASTLAIGSHKVVISPVNKNIVSSKKTSTIKVAKAQTTVKAPKVTAKYKKSKYFKVTVKNKATKKVVNKLKVKIKVYTGKKYKTFTVKTNKKGVAQINTKSLKKGTHKVVISSGNSNYKISAKSSIKIK